MYHLTIFISSNALLFLFLLSSDPDREAVDEADPSLTFLFALAAAFNALGNASGVL